MIKSFKGKLTEAIWKGEIKKGFPADLVRRTQVKLAMIHSAAELADLLTPPANRLEALQGQRAGQYSIRINDQWRICLVWNNGDAEDVEVVDYH
jgi:proteic killer suppression protein